MPLAMAGCAKPTSTYSQPVVVPTPAMSSTRDDCDADGAQAVAMSP
jgi:hypothetical protein